MKLLKASATPNPGACVEDIHYLVGTTEPGCHGPTRIVPLDRSHHQPRDPRQVQRGEVLPCPSPGQRRLQTRLAPDTSGWTTSPTSSPSTSEPTQPDSRSCVTSRTATCSCWTISSPPHQQRAPQPNCSTSSPPAKDEGRRSSPHSSTRKTGTIPPRRGDRRIDPQPHRVHRRIPPTRRTEHAPPHIGDNACHAQLTVAHNTGGDTATRCPHRCYQIDPLALPKTSAKHGGRHSPNRGSKPSHRTTKVSCVARRATATPRAC